MRNSINHFASEMRKNTKIQADNLNIKLPKEFNTSYSPLLTPPFEPMLKNRWILNFPKKFGIPNWVVSSTSLPTYPFASGNVIFVQMYDPINLSITDKLIDALDKQGFKIKIRMVDPTGVAIEKWVLYDCEITNIDWGTLDYKCSEPQKINVTISYNDIKFKQI
jgi:hypothetical protein